MTVSHIDSSPRIQIAIDADQLMHRIKHCRIGHDNHVELTMMLFFTEILWPYERPFDKTWSRDLHPLCPPMGPSHIPVCICPCPCISWYKSNCDDQNQQQRAKSWCVNQIGQIGVSESLGLSQLFVKDHIQSQKEKSVEILPKVIGQRKYRRENLKKN